MTKFKLSGLIIGGIASAGWVYFSAGSIFYKQPGTVGVIVNLVLAVLFIIPFILAWKMDKIAGWIYIFLAIFLGGGYYYITFFISNLNYYWWIWLIMLLLFFVFPLTAGLLLIKSKNVDKNEL